MNWPWCAGPGVRTRTALGFVAVMFSSNADGSRYHGAGPPARWYVSDEPGATGAGGCGVTMRSGLYAKMRVSIGV